MYKHFCHLEVTKSKYSREGKYCAWRVIWCVGIASW